jgi:hypothetical protein
MFWYKTEHLLLFYWTEYFHMKYSLRIGFSISFILIIYTSFLNAQFYTLETKNLTLVYLGKPHEYLVSHLGRCFENSLRFHRHLFNYTPNEKTTVFLQDFSDFHNAGATSVPRNFVQMSLAPASYIFETTPANERMNHTMSHELVHIVTTDQAAGSDHFFRSVFFGKVWPSLEQPGSIIYSYLTSPRKLSPRWYMEGLAVFWETWMAGGLGRAMGAYDEMVFRSMVRDSSYIYDVVGLESEGTTIDFQVGVNSYLYGTRFISYLAYKYGPEKILEWAARTEDSKKYFASQFKKVYRISLDEEWSRWITWEQQWQQANLDFIRLNHTTPFRPISKTALGSISRSFYDPTSRNLYAALLYPGQVAHIAAINIDTGTIDEINEVKGPGLYYVSSLTYDPSEGLIFYTTDNNRWRDLNVVDIKTGKSKRLMKDVRTGGLTFNRVDKSIWGVRHYNGISTLVRIPHPYQEWNQIYSFPYGQDIFDIDISPDGSMITAAFVDISGRQKLIKMDATKLMEGETSYTVLFDFENSLPESFVFSPDGRYLYGSSYYSGVSNIYRYDFQREDMNILSNCESGFFRPVPVSEDSLIVMRYTGEGFVPVMIANDTLTHVSAINFLGNEIVKKHPIVKDWILGPPSAVNIDSLTISTGKYSPIRSVGLNSIYPIIEGYKVYSSVGLRADFSDRLGITGFDLTASYSPGGSLPDDERFHAALNFHYWQWKLSATYNKADFYDLFGPTKTSRKGYSLGIEYSKNLLYDRPKSLDFHARAVGYAGLERLPDFQNVAATFDKFMSADFWLDYNYVRKSLGAVDDEKGIRGVIFSRNTYINSEIIPLMFANLDYGIPLAINHSSIWLRSSAGYSFGERDDPNANFFFGGFGNNYVDYQDEKRYREFYSFPGAELNSIGGTNYGKLMLEWTLAPLRFRRVGIPNLYARWARFALFSSGIVTNIDSDSLRRTVYNIGGQLDFRLILLSRLESTFSLGYGAAFEKNRRLLNEFMISLKIL